MLAIILATDEQRTLPPLTDAMPAPLLPVVNRPVMATSIELLARAGIKRILVSLCNRGGPIAASFGSGRRWGVELEYLNQREGWGTAGALRWAGRLLTETFLVLPGDSILDLDIEAALAFHRSHGGPATAILHAGHDGRAPRLALGPGGRVGAAPGPGAQELSATGAFIFEPAVLEQIPARTSFDCLSDLLPALQAAGSPIYGYRTGGYWNSLRSAAALHEAQRVYLYSAYAQRDPEAAARGPAERVRFPDIAGRQIAAGVWIGHNPSIHPSVKLAPPVFIGDESWIGREAELGAGTVIGSNVVIDEEASVSGALIFSQTYVGRLTNLEGRIALSSAIIDPASGEDTRVVDPFLLGRVGPPETGQSRPGRVLSGVAAALLLAGLSPLFALAWLIAAVGTLGRPFTRAPRVNHLISGRGPDAELQTFALLRFQTRRQDGRPIPLGRLLERWELHRLPELINVLRGELALVGVSPISPEQAALLTEEWHQKRFEAPAGFTGLWYQQTDPSSELDTVVVADVYYTATRTWRTDLLLALRTPASWLRRASRTSPAAPGQPGAAEGLNQIEQPETA